MRRREDDPVKDRIIEATEKFVRGCRDERRASLVYARDRAISEQRFDDAADARDLLEQHDNRWSDEFIRRRVEQCMQPMAALFDAAEGDDHG